MMLLLPCRCSAGIACSKLLSKLVSGLHKPDDQTTILPTQAQVRGSCWATGVCCHQALPPTECIECISVVWGWRDA